MRMMIFATLMACGQPDSETNVVDQAPSTETNTVNTTNVTNTPPAEVITTSDVKNKSKNTNNNTAAENTETTENTSAAENTETTNEEKGELNEE